MKNSYRIKTETLAKKMACTIESGGDPYEVLIQAPKGFHFDEGIHEMVNSTWDDESPADIWRNAYTRLSISILDPCTKECE